MEHDSYIGLSNKWVSAKDLKCGDKVLLSDGSYGIIDSVIVNDLVEQEVTYNFEVEDFHTYFVGEYCVCVHNVKCGDYELANRGSTGRETPENLNEQIVMNSAKGDPSIGEKLPITLNDPRWSSANGWAKYQIVGRSDFSNNVTVHYVRNDLLMLVDDFKIK